MVYPASLFRNCPLCPCLSLIHNSFFSTASVAYIPLNRTIPQYSQLTFSTAHWPYLPNPYHHSLPHTDLISPTHPPTLQANFVIGIGDQGANVYCVDFGLSKRYRHPKTLQHIPHRDGRSLTGTPRYARWLIPEYLLSHPELKRILLRMFAFLASISICIIALSSSQILTCSIWNDC